MPLPSRKYPFKDVVIIADLLIDDREESLEIRRDLESSDNKTIQEIIGAVRSLNLGVHHYHHPRELAVKANKHTKDIVLSIFGGAVSRNRMALVPAVCEAFGLSFIGPDTYGRILCQDKEIAKSLASEAGLRTMPHRIIRSKTDLKHISDFPIPYVAKPIWEGSSIGISSRNLVMEKREGEILVEAMLTRFDQPIMVEAFAPGREVSWCFIERPGNDRLSVFGEIVWENDAAYFDHHLYDAQHKMNCDGKTIIGNIDDELSVTDRKSLNKLLEYAGHLGYGRIDGKFRNGKFVFLELTPDAWLGSTGTFASSFMNLGMPFDEIIARLLLSASTDRRDQ